MLSGILLASPPDGRVRQAIRTHDEAVATAHPRGMVTRIVPGLMRRRFNTQAPAMRAAGRARTAAYEDFLHDGSTAS